MSAELQQHAPPGDTRSRSMSIDGLIARGLLPDWIIRLGIRRLLR